jgi:hypothetical protein
MNTVLKNTIRWMFQKNIIGHKHFPEKLMIKSKVSRLPKIIQKEFYEEYESLMTRGFFIKLKKRTGKGSEWHISINPETANELKELMGEQDENAGWEIL